MNQNRIRAADPEQLNRYKTTLVKCMEFLDGHQYPTDQEFTNERLNTLTPLDIYRWLATKAYGTDNPGPEDDPVHARWTSLQYYKKAISFFIPNRHQPWNSITNTGNPTKSKEVNSLLKAIKKKEVRGLGADSKADRALTLEEYEQALRLMNGYEDERKRYMYPALTKFQLHMIGRMDDSCHTFRQYLQPSEQFSFALTIRMRWSKNVTEERDAPTQIVLASMNALHCVHLALAAYLEIFLSRGEDRGSIYLFNCLECDGPKELNRSARKYLENDIFSSPQFAKTKPGNIGSHSVKKRATTRARASGCKKDHVDYRARWKNLKRQQDRYTENELVYPDAEVAGVLCHGGPCEYAIKEGVNISNEWIIEHVTPNVSRVFGNGVAFILGKALLWAIFANSEECVITIPQEMKQRVQAAYRRIMVRSQNENNQIIQPIEKYLLVISNMEEAVMITRARNQRMLSAPVGVIGEYDTRVDGIPTILNHNRLDDMERTIVELKNANDHNFQAMDARLERMERSIKRLMMMPFRMQVQPSIPEADTGTNERRTNTVGNRNPSEARPSFESSLVANPRDLFVLWQEYEFGVGGRKAAKLFTSSERGKVKFKYSRRKIVWECIHRLIRSGYTADSAIDKIYDVYGRSTSVSTIINRMREDEKQGGRPELN